MRRLLIGLVIIGFVGGGSGLALAQDFGEQTVTYEVQAIDEFFVSGDPAALIIDSADAGSQPADATENSTSYAISTNGASKKITGVLDTAMPADVVLKVNLSAPVGSGSSAGDVILTAGAADLVTGISAVAENTLGITYILSATISAGVVASASKTVTLTITVG